MGKSLRRLEKGDYEGALARLEEPEGTTNKLLYRLEKGLILHYQGRYQESNVQFERAERLIDRLFTRSLSREVTALLTNDAIIAYRGEEFERALIHYYRAMNYERLGDRQAALVECRKANLKLEEYASRAEYELSYKNDAFLQYMTGLFYEAEGEWNDAYISYKDAEKGYRAYEEALGLAAPRLLGRDLARLAHKLGYQEEVQQYRERYRLRPEEVEPAEGGEVVVFVESGFVPRKRQVELNVPILEDEDKGGVWVASERAVYYYHHPHAYRARKVSYWLRVALPEYRRVPSRVRAIRVRGQGEHSMAVLAEDLSVLAEKTFAQKFDTILGRTVARALAKYALARGVEKAFEDEGEDDVEGMMREGAGKFLGALVNLFGMATEAADTRAWLSLPGAVYMARLEMESGTAELSLEFLDERGSTIEVQSLPPVRVVEGGKAFVSARTFR
jgi:hypothetical protein